MVLDFSTFDSPLSGLGGQTPTFSGCHLPLEKNVRRVPALFFGDALCHPNITWQTHAPRLRTPKARSCARSLTPTMRNTPLQCNSERQSRKGVRKREGESSAAHIVRSSCTPDCVTPPSHPVNIPQRHELPGHCATSSTDASAMNATPIR